MYEGINKKEVIEPGGDWIIEFRWTDGYAKANSQRNDWHRLKESWWVNEDVQEDLRLVDMIPRALEPLIASRASTVFASAMTSGDVETWRYRNVVTNEVIAGEIICPV